MRAVWGVRGDAKLEEFVCVLLRIVWTCEVVGLGGGSRGECELQFLLCGRLRLPLQKGICHSPQTMGTCLQKGLSCLFLCLLI